MAPRNKRQRSRRPSSDSKREDNDRSQVPDSLSSDDVSAPPIFDNTEDSSRATSSFHSSHLSSSTLPLSILAGTHNAAPGINLETMCDAMASLIYSKQEEKIWSTGGIGEGVLIKKSRGIYFACPGTLKTDGSSFHRIIQEMNVKAAMTIKTNTVEMLLSDSDISFVQIDESHRIQVLDDVKSLPFCQRHQSAAFLKAEKILVVWEDEVSRLLEHATRIEEGLHKTICEANIPNEKLNKDASEKPTHRDQEQETETRETVVIYPIITALIIMLTVAAIGSGYLTIMDEIMIDLDFTRIIFLICFLPQFWLGLFFFQAIMGNIAQIIGPTRWLRRNTKFYSGKAPDRICVGRLPHVTIQMPIYKENLRTVIAPSISTLKKAIATYEMQGGSANIFINDDGMQNMADEAAQERQTYYDENNIGWVARPPHNPKGEDPEKPLHNRQGKFKKASNMNYALRVSMDLEAAMERYTADRQDRNKPAQMQRYTYFSELAQLTDRNGAWADGDIRIGEYILLVDSDTRVPEDCLLEAVSEMENSPHVAVLQFACGVLNVTDTFFEKGITFFTNLVYTMIKFAVANGDIAPFVGHNAMLRWNAVKEVSYMGTEERCVQKMNEQGNPLSEHLMSENAMVDPQTGELVCDENGEPIKVPVYDEHGVPLEIPLFETKEVEVRKYWSENTVSEDFDMALRLQGRGYLVRLAGYQGKGFQEGVSITVDDELNRWEKYAFGCNELIFNPLAHWVTRGPINPIFLRFLTSGIPLASKITISSYIGTYYAIGSAWILTLMNYLLIGWLNGQVDHYYLDSFRIYFSVICIFTGLGNAALAIHRYRIGEMNGFRSMYENIKWIPLLVIFLGGVSAHISQALLSHLFSVNITWGATSKEAKHVKFSDEVWRVLKRFRWTFTACIGMTVAMVVAATVPPGPWKITIFTAVFPMASQVVTHFLLPVVLNPNLMMFTW